MLQYYSEMVPAAMTIVAIVIVILEWIALTITERIESHKEGIVNILSAALTYLPIFTVNTFLTVFLMFIVYEYRIFNLGFEWYVWVMAYIGYDFMSYILHLLSHKVRFFWCIHSVHHSPKEMKASVSFRGSFAEFILAPHLILWLPLLGFHPLLIIIVEGVGQLYGVPLHVSEKFFKKGKKSWIHYILITPSIHRIHHAKNDIYLDTNYGLTFALWDYLFRTFQHERKEDNPVYGLTNDVDSENLLVSQTDEFVELWKDIKSTNNIVHKLKYLLMPPGWNHIDGGITAKDIREKILAHN
ncbi:sterol desaturase family protein [Candidatus Uabimicrobium sp. HlEnr_7]|uniref:sterol desaturase family protein n=1 Tax=Candidatus Uabimicrobium helgolandensis TaxID=3095367 RepID=UPI003557986D